MYCKLNEFLPDECKFAFFAKRSSPCTLRCKRYNSSSSARGSICFNVGSLKLPPMFLYTRNLLHRTVLPETFTSNLSQNVHCGGNICVVNLGSLQRDRDVETSSTTSRLCFNRSKFLVKFGNNFCGNHRIPNRYRPNFLECSYKHLPRDKVNQVIL